MINKISNLPCSLSARKFKIKRVMLLLRNQITLEESFLPKDLYFSYPFAILLLSVYYPSAILFRSHPSGSVVNKQ